ncbi:MAG: PAS domain-containing sensor histidine kinase [Desulfobacterales bacterium]|jgi:PAS domain S-box-containing protein
MSQGLEKQLENVLLELAKDNQNSDLTDLNTLIQELNTYQDVLEQQNNDLRQEITKLKKSRNYYRDLYDSAPTAFFTLDNQGIILDVNFAGTELIGVEKSQLISSDLAQRVAPDFMDAFFYHRKWTLESDVRQTCELKLVKGDCSTFFAHLESISLALNDGDQTSIQTIITDISDQKQTESTLELAKTRAEDAGKIKGEFLSKMSHEFRTPLNHIIGFTGLALEDSSGNLNATQKEYLDAVVQSSHHLLTLVKDILDLSKLEAGTLELEPTDVKLKTLLENGIAGFEQKAVDRGMTLLKDFDGAPDTIRADEGMLKQIVYHLLSNALKFTNDGGEVLLSARTVDCIVRSGRRCGDARDLKIFQECIETRNMIGAELNKCVEVSVADTGIGLNAEDQKNVFEPFKQVDESLSRTHQGAGIGLSLAKSLVELQGGKIWVESEGESKGSTFRFILPI